MSQQDQREPGVSLRNVHSCAQQQ